MNPFLRRIAKCYIESDRALMADCCFVFPNKRSGAFFRQYLVEEADDGNPVFEPEITTISDFIADFSSYVEASRYDQLFTLYNEYAKLSGEIEDFDKFVFWGDMLLTDFSDVDRYLVDADKLFKNITDYNSIATDFLTPEQKAIVKRYWGVELTETDPEQFWLHLNENREPRTNRESFVELWEILAPLYRNYKQSLGERGLCFSGMQYKEVADRLAALSAEELPYKRIIFVGFNVLSTTELKIFSRLRDIGIADFYWDMDLPEPFKSNRSATYFLKRYIKEFPSRHDITLADIPMPDIEIISVPSNVGQVKLTGKTVDTMVADGTISDPDNAIDTAVVLPSEELFIDLLHSLPGSIGAVNITMGYPLKLTSIAVLLRNVMTMHMRARRVRDQWCFFHDDVRDVVAHPLLKNIAGETCDRVSDTIERQRLFTVPVDFLRNEFPELEAVFFPVDELRRADKVFDYLNSLIDFITGKMGDDNDGNHAMEKGFLIRYRASLHQLRDAIDTYGISMRERTFFHLIERTVNAETVNFEGEPLKGLQIMGVLETRALDFDNVIIMSMNERIFPRKHYTRSFIPDVLRRSYGMSTMEFQECIYAYYFYRLISRAKKVMLMYDSRTSGLKGGEMSRYLYQLIYLCGGPSIRRAEAVYDLPAPASGGAPVIGKDERIMGALNRYLSPGKDKATLSPSAINTYLQCPLRFYFHYVERIRVADDINDYIDESTFGTIVHQVSELSYVRLRGDAQELLVTEPVLDKLKKEIVELQKLITSSINQHYNRLPSTAPEGSPYINLAPLHGESRVMAQVIEKFMVNMFDLERKFTPFHFVEGEHPFSVRLPLDEERSYNLVGSIDRIDRQADGSFRIVDYKTGVDPSWFKELEHLVEERSATEGHHKAILQLFLYCNAFAVEKNYGGAIQPILYRFKKFSTDGITPLSFGKSEKSAEPVTDYRTLNDEVMRLLNDRLQSLFDPGTPFEASPSPSHCRFCDFQALCGANKQ